MLQEELQRYFCRANDGAHTAWQKLGDPPSRLVYPVSILYNLEKKMSLITNMLRFRCWIVDDNEAEIIIIRTSLIGPTYVPRYLQRISMETGKTPWGCQQKARSKEFNLQTRRQPGCQHKSKRKEFKKGTICRFMFFCQTFSRPKVSSVNNLFNPTHWEPSSCYV